MTIASSLEKFRSGIKDINSFISMAYPPGEQLEKEKIAFIVESSFLKMFICWEEFLESVFALYLIGEKSTDGKKIECHVNPIDIDHAHAILIGSQTYFDWANSEMVQKLAKIFLKDGEPLHSNLSSISTDLKDLKTIRNAAAHISRSTQTKLNAAASRITRKTVTSITVTDLVMTMHPDKAYKDKTIFQYYQNILDITAENIAKA